MVLKRSFHLRVETAVFWSVQKITLTLDFSENMLI